MNDIDLTAWVTTDLLYDLERQFPLGATTWGECPLCGSPSRGVGPCVTCLTDELERRGFPAFDFAEACRARQGAGIKIAEMREVARG